MRGVVVDLSRCAPTFARMSTVFLPAMLVWVLSFCMKILYGVQYIWCITAIVCSLFGWGGVRTCVYCDYL